MSHENHRPIANILKGYEANSFWFADGDPGCFDSEEILKFETWKSARVIVDLAWKLNQTALGVAIWETEDPDYITYNYVNSGEEKNNQVKFNREN